MNSAGTDRSIGHNFAVYAISLLVFLSAWFIGAGQAAAATSFTDVTLNTSTPAVYDMLEVSFNLDAVYSNPFDPEEADVRAYVTTPSNQTHRIPAFYKSDSSPNWAVRYAPLETGSHSFYLEVTDNAGTAQTSAYSFTAVAPGGNRGFMGVQGTRFVDSQGHQLTLIGTNYAWSHPDYILESMEDYEDAKMNLMRVWLSVWWGNYAPEWGPTTVENNGIEMAYAGIGKYQLDNMARFDTLMQTAEAHNIYIDLVVNSFGDLYYNWETNAYNQANGGPSYWNVNDTDIWTNPTAIAYQKKLLRYLFARYGYSRALGLLEYWNESDNMVDTAAANRDAWHYEMDTFWKSWDFYKHPTTTSFAWKDHAHQNHLSWEGLTTLDAVNVHKYRVETDMLDVWEAEIKNMLANYGNRPSYIGEYGRTGTDDSAYPDNVRYYHDGIWAPVFRAGAAGANLTWLFDQYTAPKSAFDVPQMYKDMYTSLADFVQPEEKYLIHMPHVDYGLQGNDTKIGGFQNRFKALFWINDSTALYTDDSPQTVSGMSFTVPDMLSGTYDVTFYDTYAGSDISTTTAVVTTGDLLIAGIPSFERDIAVRAVLQGSGDDDTTPPSAPANLASPAQTDHTVSLEWEASTDDIYVVGYRIYSGSTLIGSVADATEFVVADLTPGTAYTFAVKAVDSGYNESASSNVLAVSTVPAPAEPDNNVLLNPFFEINDGTGKALHWTCEQAGLCGLDNNVKKSGYYSLKAGGTSGAWFGIRQSAAAMADETYAFSGYVNVAEKTGTMEVEVRLQFLNSAESILANHLMGTFDELTDGFVRVSGSYTAPANTAAVRVFVHIKGMRGAVHLDEFLLLEGDEPEPEPTPELLLNPGFEDDDGAGRAEYWTCDSASFCSLDSAVKRAGASSLKISGTSGAWFGIHQTTEATADETYDFAGYVNVTGRTGEMTIEVRLQFLDDTETILGNHLLGSFDEVTSGFTEVSGSYTAPANTADARVFVHIKGMRGTFHLDDFSLRQSEEPLPEPGVLLNPDFEENDGAGRAKYWICDQPSFCSLDSAVKKSGASSLKISGANGAWFNLHQTVEAAASETYDFAGYVNVTDRTGEMTIEVRLQFVDGAEAVLSNHLLDSFTEVTTGFAGFAGSYTAPANTENVRLMIQIKGMRGTFHLDEFSLQPL